MTRLRRRLALRILLLNDVGDLLLWATKVRRNGNAAWGCRSKVGNVTTVHTNGTCWGLLLLHIAAVPVTHNNVIVGLVCVRVTDCGTLWVGRAWEFGTGQSWIDYALTTRSSKV